MQVIHCQYRRFKNVKKNLFLQKCKTVADWAQKFTGFIVYFTNILRAFSLYISHAKFIKKCGFGQQWDSIHSHLCYTLRLGQSAPDVQVKKSQLV